MNGSIVKPPDLSGHSAAVVGCGGLGTNAAVHLAGMGISRLLLMDFDTVEAQNLNRQFMYTPCDVGQPKSTTLASRLRAYAPACETAADVRKICTADDLAPALGADVLIAAVDNLAARRILNDWCGAHGVPLVSGGVHGLYGHAYLYLPGRSPDLAAAGLLDAENRQPVSVSSTVGVIGALQAQLAAQALTGSGAQYGGRLYIFDHNEIHSLQIR